MKKIKVVLLAFIVVGLFSCKKETTVKVQEITLKDQTFTVNENSAANTIIGSVVASVDSGTIMYSIKNQSISGAMSINSSTGELKVAKESAFDYETNTTLTATVTAKSGSNSKESKITVNITDVPDTLNSTNQTFTVDENLATGALIGTFQVNSDMSNIEYSISNQSVAGALEINSSTGQLKVAQKSIFDYETNPTIMADVTAKSGDASTKSKVTIQLNDLFNLEEDREALIRIYNANPDKLSWDIASSDVSTFEGVRVKNNRVFALNIVNKKITTVPDNALYNLTALTNLGLFYNKLTTINVSNNKELKQLLLSVNRLRAIDISMLSKLTDLKAHSNLITSANLANGNNNKMWRMELQGNNGLTCIKVDSGFNGKSGWSKPSGAEYKTNCN